MSSRVLWGFLLIFGGAIFLAVNLNLLTADVWNTLWRTWPALLVLWGLSILMRPLGRLGVLITAAAVVLFAGGLVVYAYNYAPGSEGGSVPLSRPLEAGIETVDLDIAYGVGTITIDGTAPDGLLAAGVLGYIVPEPEIVYRPSGSRAELKLSFRSGRWSLPFGGRPPSWDIHLSPVPAYRITANLGACEADLDFTGLTVREFDLKTGAASLKIRFGSQDGDLRSRIEMGAASLVLRLPRSVGVSVSVSSGLTETNLLAAGFDKSGETWFSPGYDQADVKYDFEIKAGVSSVSVEWTG